MEDTAIPGASVAPLRRDMFRLVETVPTSLAERLVRSVLLERGNQDGIQVDPTKIVAATNLAVRLSTARGKEKVAIVQELDYRLGIALDTAKILTNAHPASFTNDILTLVYPQAGKPAISRWAESVASRFRDKRGVSKISQSLSDTNIAVNLLISHCQQISCLQNAEKAS